MTIYDKFVKGVASGRKFRIELKNKTMKLGKEVLIDEGKYVGELIGDIPKDPWEMLEELFYRYYISVPCERSDRKPSYFATKELKDMTDFELAGGEPRLVAQAKLEGFVLCAVLAGMLKWNSLYGSWFWQSKRYPQLVMLKDWF